MNKEFIIKYELPEEVKNIPKSWIYAAIPFLP
jgi:hypothetical protein